MDYLYVDSLIVSALLSITTRCVTLTAQGARIVVATLQLQQALLVQRSPSTWVGLVEVHVLLQEITVEVGHHTNSVSFDSVALAPRNMSFDRQRHGCGLYRQFFRED